MTSGQPRECRGHSGRGCAIRCVCGRPRQMADPRYPASTRSLAADPGGPADDRPGATPAFRSACQIAPTCRCVWTPCSRRSMPPSARVGRIRMGSMRGGNDWSRRRCSRRMPRGGSAAGPHRRYARNARALWEAQGAVFPPLPSFGPTCIRRETSGRRIFSTQYG